MKMKANQQNLMLIKNGTYKLGSVVLPISSGESMPQFANKTKVNQ